MESLTKGTVKESSPFSNLLKEAPFMSLNRGLIKQGTEGEPEPSWEQPAVRMGKTWPG